MLVDESRRTFEDIIRSGTPEAAEIAVSLRRLIQELFPDVMEKPRPAEKHAEYDIETGKLQDVFVYNCPIKGYVRLGFYYDAVIPNPAGCWLAVEKGGGISNSMQYRMCIDRKHTR